VKDDEASERRFIEQQHRFRGLIAEFKSRRFVEDRKVPPARRFRSGLSKLLLDVRAVLEREQYRPFLEWQAETMRTQLGEVLRSPAHYDDLVGIYPRAPVLPLEEELLWIAERLRTEKVRIVPFLGARALIERATVAGQYAAAIEGVAMLQQAIGVTLWSVQLRLALEHQASGLERQKQYSAEVRAVFKRGLLGFVTYYTSVRNEDRTTFSKFLDDIENRIANHRHYDDETRTYMRYRLKNEYPPETSRLADLLRVEQNHGVLDLYETYVAVLQEIAGRAPDRSLTQLILKCIECIEVDDFRLTKIARLLDPSIACQLPERNSSASDALFGGDANLAARAAHQLMKDEAAADPWQFIYAGFAFAHDGPARSRRVPRPEPPRVRRRPLFRSYAAMAAFSCVA
jgi:hypothetical protein